MGPRWCAGSLAAPPGKSVLPPSISAPIRTQNRGVPSSRCTKQRATLIRQLQLARGKLAAKPPKPASPRQALVVRDADKTYLVLRLKRVVHDSSKPENGLHAVDPHIAGALGAAVRVDEHQEALGPTNGSSGCGAVAIVALKRWWLT